MKALVVIAHYFRPQKGAIYSSLDENRKDMRRQGLEELLLCWQAHCNETALLDCANGNYVISPSLCERLDFAILVNGDAHLLDKGLLNRHQARIVNVETEDPRFLPFAAQKVIADSRRNYDWFVYSEDDLAVRDALFFQKLAAFQKAFGPNRVLQPHRYELNPAGPRFKTYIDGDLSPSLIQPYLALVKETTPILKQDTGLGTIEYSRALNPHSGMFALSAEQVEYFTSQPHFMHIDCSFVSPLESAATLAIMKSFSMFKTTAPNMGYFDIEHLDRKYSSLRRPIVFRKGTQDGNALQAV